MPFTMRGMNIAFIVAGHWQLAAGRFCREKVALFGLRLRIKVN